MIHLEDLHNLVKEHFPINQQVMLWDYTHGKTWKMTIKTGMPMWMEEISKGPTPE